MSVLLDNHSNEIHYSFFPQRFGPDWRREKHGKQNDCNLHTPRAVIHAALRQFIGKAIGHDLASPVSHLTVGMRQEIKHYIAVHPNNSALRAIFVEAPGFNAETLESDAEIINRVAAWLQKS